MSASAMRTWTTSFRSVKTVTRLCIRGSAGMTIVQPILKPNTEAMLAHVDHLFGWVTQRMAFRIIRSEFWDGAQDANPILWPRPTHALPGTLRPSSKDGCTHSAPEDLTRGVGV